ncbi:unnamed protein product [Rotaria socialis]|uniref:Uncharacterized protein n=1 Tax=Rotaria socialis TaxID=392032 RepID=A0A818PGE5_9BILA|nr:unnamed protein product [Rotaria socialis]CAF3355677.1 unnamed protein product [Rotaria socialis]CAF3623026.1 unnamed protein product [Rotaria socialis]CAF4107319.1 unnamed protein product [Rotaria socialis]CAF4372272.1 unnamed protein product [Rotaria socialis]
MMLERLLLVGFLFYLLSITNCQFNKDDLTKLKAFECDEPFVTLHVFSGASNPTWQINIKQLIKIKKIAYRSLYQNNSDTLYSKPTKRIMGYHGFTVSCSFNKLVFVHGLSPVEHLLLLSGRRYLSESVIGHVKEHIGEIMSEITPMKSNHADCDQVPIVGPDTVPVYDPKSDDQGCFIKKQSENNCYAYGTDIVTNTFPQPGRGSGRKWSLNTCLDMGNASVRDGLIYNGTQLPQIPPSVGHFAALLIWPDTNFHWIRMDANGYWSHKPGGTPVRNEDNRGLPITDPSKSDFSPWTQFCAYFIAQPSKLRIQ